MTHMGPLWYYLVFIWFLSIFTPESTQSVFFVDQKMAANRRQAVQNLSENNWTILMGQIWLLWIISGI